MTINRLRTNEFIFWLTVRIAASILPDDSESKLIHLMNRLTIALRYYIKDREKIRLDTQIY